MNAKDEALKMAIEAMETSKEAWHQIGIYDAMYDGLVKAINACKEALESQEIGDAEIRQMLNDIEYYQKRVEALEQPEQEPRSIMESFDKMLAEKLVYYKEKHPAQPLSDDAVNAILVKHGWNRS